MAIRIGVVGAGCMAAYHIPGFKAGGAEVVAIADVNEAAAKNAAAKYGVGKVYTDVADMLASEDLDAVSVITPNKFHKPLVLQALKAGKHVFCEKPPALNAAEITQMAAAAKKAGKMLVFDFNNRARPEACAMKKAIDAGRVGKINSAQALWIRRTGIPGFGGWFTTKALSGGGPVIDLLHMIDLALYFMGYPEPMCSRTPSTTSWATSASRDPGASQTVPTVSATSSRRPTDSSPSRMVPCFISAPPGPR